MVDEELAGVVMRLKNELDLAGICVLDGKFLGSTSHGRAQAAAAENLIFLTYRELQDLKRS
jgi:hypothetical protein